MVPYGMIASGVGSVMQNVAGNIAQEKMKQVFQREMDNQNRYRNESFGQWQQNAPLQGVEQAGVDLGQGADRRNQAYSQINQSPLGIGEQQTGRGQINFDLAGNNRANLGAYSDWKLNGAIRQIRLQDELNRISNFSAGDASVLPGLMNDAQHSQDELAMWGKIIASLGGAAGSFGASSPQLGQQNSMSPIGFSGSFSGE